MTGDLNEISVAIGGLLEGQKQATQDRKEQTETLVTLSTSVANIDKNVSLLGAPGGRVDQIDQRLTTLENAVRPLSDVYQQRKGMAALGRGATAVFGGGVVLVGQAIFKKLGWLAVVAAVLVAGAYAAPVS